MGLKAQARIDTDSRAVVCGNVEQDIVAALREKVSGERGSDRAGIALPAGIGMGEDVAKYGNAIIGSDDMRSTGGEDAAAGAYAIGDAML